MSAQALATGEVYQLVNVNSGLVADVSQGSADNGVSIIIDAKAVLFLLGSVIDYEVTPMHSKFTFSNPNATGGCGCGSSFTV